jgi:hypothetical protein
MTTRKEGSAKRQTVPAQPLFGFGGGCDYMYDTICEVEGLLGS